MSGIVNCALVTLLSMNNSVYHISSLRTFTENNLKGSVECKQSLFRFPSVVTLDQ